MKKRILISMIILLAGYSAVLKPMDPIDVPIAGDFKKTDILTEALNAYSIMPRYLAQSLIEKSQQSQRLLSKHPSAGMLLINKNRLISRLNAIDDLLNDPNVEITPEGRTLLENAIKEARANLLPPVPPVAPPVVNVAAPAPIHPKKKDEPKAAQGTEKE